VFPTGPETVRHIAAVGTTRTVEFVTVGKQSTDIVLRANWIRHCPGQVICVKGNPSCTLPVASQNLWNLAGELIMMQMHRHYRTESVELSRYRFVEHVPLQPDRLQ
jgi:hypothetical protein